MDSISTGPVQARAAETLAKVGVSLAAGVTAYLAALAWDGLTEVTKGTGLTTPLAHTVELESGLSIDALLLALSTTFFFLGAMWVTKKLAARQPGDERRVRELAWTFSDDMGGVAGTFSGIAWCMTPRGLIYPVIAFACMLLAYCLKRKAGNELEKCARLLVQEQQLASVASQVSAPDA